MTSISDEQLFSHADRVKGKVVVITGGANGIGRETASKFTQHGAKVVIGDRDVAGGEQIAKELRAAGGEVIATKCDVTVWEDQVALFQLAFSKFGAVDIVIPNAGVNEIHKLDEIKLENGVPLKPKLTTIDVNLTGVLYTTHLALHYLPQNRVDPDSLKALVLIGSIASWNGIPKAPLYTASKHAVLGVMRSLSPILEEQNIRIGCIHPFFADTNIVPLPAKLFLAGIPKTPVPRIAGAIFYAATDRSPASNGSAWLLTDDGPVFQVPKEEFKEGVYGMIDRRKNALLKGAKGIIYYANFARDIVKILGRPVLYTVAAVLLARFIFTRMVLG
ncbi:hypothetical protein HGRIS_002949 [Hohenbuehelia grisea]|uniref:Ketoreductase domain-containing protein n=1 Tax=Hohenbuehelia grisea TaxID=104357 RepID=A0ABR3JND2_9AGAR